MNLANLTFTITLITSLSSIQAQIVNIPDANFKSYLLGNPAINTNSDTEIQLSEASAFDGSILCGNLNIGSLTGIESFISITELSCFDNQIANLDLTSNVDLTSLNCANNELVSLGISSNSNLTYLSCGNNLLTNLDLSSNTLLEDVQCGNNNLLSLNVNNSAQLFSLYCNNNSLTNLDLSSNPNLQYFGCYFNQLTSLDLSLNLSLLDFNCQNNQITSLDLSNNNLLTNLYCLNNQLNYLNIQNGNNINMINSNFFAMNNPDLTCIQVDDTAYSNANWTNINPTSSFSTNCSISASVANNSNLNNIFVYPNPSSGLVYLSDNFNVVLMDVKGGIILNQENTNYFNFTQETAGIYILTLKDENRNLVYRNKIIKE